MSRTSAKNTASLTIPSWMLVVSKIVDYAGKLKNGKSETSSKEDSKEVKTKVKGKSSSPDYKSSLVEIKKKWNQLISKSKQRPKTTIGIVAIIFVLLLVLFNINNGGKTPVVGKLTNSSTNYSPENTVEVARAIEIPIRQPDGSDTGQRLKITFSTIEKAKRILIKGQGATARDGKAFLILNMEIENSTNNQLTVRPVDFIRLVETEGRSFAPDVHNEDIQVEPISIKKTRVGYVVSDDQSNFIFSIGEISGEKQTIELVI